MLGEARAEKDMAEKRAPECREFRRASIASWSYKQGSSSHPFSQPPIVPPHLHRVSGPATKAARGKHASCCCFERAFVYFLRKVLGFGGSTKVPSALAFFSCGCDRRAKSANDVSRASKE